MFACLVSTYVIGQKLNPFVSELYWPLINCQIMATAIHWLSPDQQGGLSVSFFVSSSLSLSQGPVHSLMDLGPVPAQMETLETNIFHLLVRGLLLFSLSQTRL